MPGCQKTSRTANVRGIYLGGQLNAFGPCGEKKVYWVEGPQAALKALRVGRTMITGLGVRPVYVEIRGHIMKRRTQAEYDGTLLVDTVLAVKARRPPDCGLAKGEKVSDPRDDF